jgi:hypothetical protein
VVLSLLLVAPVSILRLPFGDIRVLLPRDPECGPHKIVTCFTLEFTKTHLGDNDA